MRGIRFIRAPSVGTVGWWLSGGISASDVAGVWQAKGAASLAASYLRLAGDQGYANIDPTIVGGVAPTWASATGWTFDGLTQWLNTGIVPVNNQSWSMLCQFSNGVGSSKHACGTFPYFMIQPLRGGNRIGYFSGGSLQPPPQLAAGNVGISGNKAYRNGIAEVGTIAAGAGAPGAIGIASNIGSLDFFGCNMQAIVVYKSTITAAQVLAVATAMAAL